MGMVQKAGRFPGNSSIARSSAKHNHFQFNEPGAHVKTHLNHAVLPGIPCGMGHGTH